MSANDAPPGTHADPPLGALVHDLSVQIPELVRSELRLAQAELTEKGKRVGIGAGLFGAAGLLAFFGAATLIATAVLALALVLPAWLAALIVGSCCSRRPVWPPCAARARSTTGRRSPAARRGRGQGRHRDREGTPRMSHRTPEQIEAEIETQRAELAATVDQLTAKLDVKARMTTESGQPRPEVLAAAGSLVALAVALVWWRRRN